MGAQVAAGTYEDPEFIRAVSAHNLERIDGLVEERCRNHSRWGWKQPRDFDYFFKSVLPRLPDANLLVVFRDVLAVGNRNQISAGQELLPNMQATLTVYSQIIRDLMTVHCPVMLMSYEKALLKPGAFVDALVEFACIDGQKKKALESFIVPSPAAYLESSYLLDGVGSVDVVNPGRVAGWASWRDMRSPVVELLLNEKLVAETRADRSRKDVLEKGLHGSGNCGFLFVLKKDRLIRPGDNVAVRIKGSKQMLPGSRIYSAVAGADTSGI
jgi:hypothetical protein